jgi:hypothetical protein
MAAVSAVHAQLSSGVQVHECPCCGALLWFVFCDRCGGHYDCDGCEDTFILRADGWYWLHANDTLEKVPAA